MVFTRRIFLVFYEPIPSMANNEVTEGKAKVFTNSNIFYNPVQEFNRDISIIALTVFAEQYKSTSRDTAKKRSHALANAETTTTDITDTSQDGIIVLEALAATGLRSIRYALEVPKIKSVIANDCSVQAVQTINRNISENGVENLVKAVNHDAIWLMQKLNFENKTIHAIDLDPYGCPTKFLDSAVNCISDGGLLLITCTDMAVLAGNTPESCYVKYGSVSLRSCACHEMALRIALHCIANICGRYGKYIVPMLSISVDFYIRVFVRVFSSQKMCKQTSSNVSMVYQCVGCEMMSLQPLGLKSPKNDDWKFSLPSGIAVSEICIHCGHKFRLGGPIWTGPLYESEFVDAMLKKVENCELVTQKRIIGMLSLIKEELHDVPLYYTVDALCGKIHCQMIPLVEFRSALLNAGYRVSLSHCKTNSVKTDAPQNFIWDILRYWAKKYPVSQKRLQENSVTMAILQKEPAAEVNFSFCKEAISQSTSSGLLRYQQNPLPHWGPGTRSKSNVMNADEVSKKLQNQNKKSRLRNEVKKEVIFSNTIAGTVKKEVIFSNTAAETEG